jgi:cbb3-type cytochrome oxidase subunit 3
MKALFAIMQQVISAVLLIAIAIVAIAIAVHIVSPT